MKRICIIVPSLKKVSPVNAAISIALGLKSSFGVVVICYSSSISDDLGLRDRLISNGVKVLNLNCNSIFDVFRAKKRIENFLSLERIDLCLSFLIKSDIALGLVKTKSIKVSSVRNMLELEYSMSHGFFMGRLASFIQSVFLKRFDKVVVMSEDMKDLFLSKNFRQERLLLVHNFLDEDRVLGLLKEKITHADANGYPVAISISSLIPRKRVDLLIKYVLKLYDSGCFFNFWILGGGSESSYLKGLVKGHCAGEKLIKFFGHIENPIPYLDRSNVFLMASESEGVSRSMMEALYLGKTCIVSDIPGNRELALSSKSAYLYQTESEFLNLLRTHLFSNERAVLSNCFGYESGLAGYRKLLVDLLDKR